MTERRRAAPLLWLCFLSWLLTAPAMGQDAAAPRWEELASLPVGAFDAAGVVSGQQLVLIGGIGQSGQALPFIQQYDLASNRWHLAGARFAQGRFNPAAVTLRDGSVLCFGGTTGAATDFRHQQALAQAWRYDPVGETLTALAEMPHAVGEPAACVLPDDRVLVVGERWAQCYNPYDNTWAPPLELRSRRRQHALALLADGRVAVVGGVMLSSIEVVDAARGVSELWPVRLPQRLDDLQAFPRADGSLWLLGGQDGDTGDTTDQTWIVSADGRTLEPGPALGVAGGMADHRLARVGPLLAMAGGESQSQGKDRELSAARIADPRTLTVWKLPNLPIAQDDACLLAVGHDLYMIGGYRVAPVLLGLLPAPTANRQVYRLRIPPERLE